jgi:hypothetical protein
MRTLLVYTLSSERPPLPGKNYALTTQLCHEKTAFPTLFLTAPHLNQHPACEKCGLNDEQKAAFKSWVEAGGSFLGIHGAGGDPVREQAHNGHSSLADWKWYIDNLIGAQFIVHSTIQPGDIHIENPSSPLTKRLPENWHRTEEWYSFDASPRSKPGFHILATVDEKSYTPGSATMGTDHPSIWWHCVGQGHAVYSALGHAGSFYAEPLMIQFLDNAMSWGLAESGKGCRAGK